MSDTASQWSAQDQGESAEGEASRDMEGGGGRDTTDDEQAGDVGGSGDVERPGSEPADGGPGADIVEDEEPVEPNEPA